MIRDLPYLLADNVILLKNSIYKMLYLLMINLLKLATFNSLFQSWKMNQSDLKQQKMKKLIRFKDNFK